MYVDNKFILYRDTRLDVKFMDHLYMMAEMYTLHLHLLVLL